MSAGRHRPSSADRFIVLAAYELRCFDRFAGDDQALRSRLQPLRAGLQRSFDKAQGSKRRLAARFFAVCSLEFQMRLRRLIKASLQASSKADMTEIELFPFSAELVLSELSPLELLLAIGQYGRAQCVPIRKAQVVEQNRTDEKVAKIGERLRRANGLLLDQMDEEVDGRIENYTLSAYTGSDGDRPSVYGRLTVSIRRSRYQHYKHLKHQIGLERMRRDPSKVATEKICKAVSRRQMKFDRDIHNILLGIFLDMEDDDLLAFESIFSQRLREKTLRRSNSLIEAARTGPVAQKEKNHFQLVLSDWSVERSFWRAYRARRPHLS